jgi:N-acetylglucosaminyldiphosphoundecaprenol N-acetyl-beta-D-mannosaminyltransferase
MERRHQLTLLETGIDRTLEAELIGAVFDALDKGRGGWICPINLDVLRQCHQREDLRRLVSSATIVPPDGMPIVWASCVAGTPLPARVAGSDLVWSLSGEAAARGRSIFLLGGALGACEAARERLTELYQGLAIAGCHSPPLGFEKVPAELAEIRTRIAAAAPDIVYVALGFPKQERLISELRHEFPAIWFVGVGISLSFLSGQVTRAPAWMIRLGLEWVHRMLQEPRRLARRYLVDDMPFALRLFGHAAWLRLSRRGVLDADDEPRPAPRVVFTHGALERERAAQVAELLADVPEPAARASRRTHT